MTLRFEHDRVLAVVAHPDDAELLCAGTLARARDDGAVIGVCVLCKGDKGQPNKRVKNLAAVRAREMAAAARLLGATLFQAGAEDGTLADIPLRRTQLIEIYRKFKPTLVLAHAPEDYHPDHCAASALALAASWFCASPGHKTTSAPLARPPALWWMDTLNMSGFSPAFHVDVTAHAALKHKMLACHKSQLARAGDDNFSPLDDLMRRQYETRGAQSGVAAAEAFRAHHAFKRMRAW